MQRCKVLETKYKEPPIPMGFEYVEGEWHNGLVIECRFDRCQFVWVPVGFLSANGTLDGVSFSEQFGRRPFKDKDEFSSEKYHEEMNEELLRQIESVRKYGGFYISRFCISKYFPSKKPMSVKGILPWTGMDFNQAKMVAEWFESCSSISSHLVYGAEYDTVIEWIIESGAKSREKVVKYSSTWGNYWNCPESERRVATLGSRREWCVNNIYDLAGNVKEWTQESFEKNYHVLRGGSHYDDGVSHPVVERTPIRNDYICHGAGFRASLCLK